VFILSIAELLAFNENFHHIKVDKHINQQEIFDIIFYGRNYDLKKLTPKEPVL
jgi:hypothetical protein